MLVYTVEKSRTASFYPKMGLLVPDQSKAILVESFKTKRAYKKWARSVF